MKKLIAPFILIIIVAWILMQAIDVKASGEGNTFYTDILKRITNISKRITKLEGLLGKRLGATFPTAIAVFETSLQSSITSSQTTMTLVSGATDDSTTLSGTYGFVIDEGGTSEEFVIAACADTACTGMLRGISVVDGTTEITALKKSHRRGATVKITNHPQLIRLIRLITGIDNLPSLLEYETANQVTADSSSTVLVDKDYVDSLVISGGVSSTEEVAGFSEFASQIEMASSTDSVNNHRGLYSKYSTSTPIDTTGNNYHYVPVTKETGRLDYDFMPTSTQWNFAETTNASTTFKSTGTTTFDGGGIIGGGMPAGIIQMYAATTSPTGWLLCDGSAVSMTTYARLFDVIGIDYGSGDGSTTFNMPDMRGRTAFGYYNSSTTAWAWANGIGNATGSTSTVLDIDQLAPHTHGLTNLQRYDGGGSFGTLYNGTEGASYTELTDETGGAEPFPILPPYMILNYIIKY